MLRWNESATQVLMGLCLFQRFIFVNTAPCFYINSGEQTDKLLRSNPSPIPANTQRGFRVVQPAVPLSSLFWFLPLQLYSLASLSRLSFGGDGGWLFTPLGMQHNVRGPRPWVAVSERRHPQQSQPYMYTNTKKKKPKKRGDRFDKSLTHIRSKMDIESPSSILLTIIMLYCFHTLRPLS